MNGKLLVVTLFLVVFALVLPFALGKIGFGSEKDLAGSIDVHFYYMEVCGFSQKQKIAIDNLQNEFSQTSFYYHDLSQQEEWESYKRVLEENDQTTEEVPFPGTLVNNRLFLGVFPEEKLRDSIVSESRKPYLIVITN
ncbi:hypothetical protein K8R43_05325 [archaeon]|nr:hypothetical protein [archaeon]